MDSSTPSPYHSSHTCHILHMFNRSSGKLQRHLCRGEYTLLKDMPVFESDFIQVSSVGCPPTLIQGCVPSPSLIHVCAPLPPSLIQRCTPLPFSLIQEYTLLLPVSGMYPPSAFTLIHMCAPSLIQGCVPPLPSP